MLMIWKNVLTVLTQNMSLYYAGPTVLLKASLYGGCTQVILGRGQNIYGL